MTAAKPTPPTLADLLRQAIRDSGKPVNTVALEAGIPQPTLHNFVHGGDMKLKTAHKLAAYLGLELRPSKRKGGTT